MAEHKTKTQAMTFNILISQYFSIKPRNAAAAGMITALVFPCEWRGAPPSLEWVANQDCFLNLFTIYCAAAIRR
ncbi:hypothetical protein JW897_05095 [Chromobacterium alkanivorans]|uniref:hypothetical protein n=1 Tax=Chromobacterium alkanivorans TaxID=1071719 RepID=UPI001967A7F8|nr:hypothetical protein [Chromobacterium alkanivorans]MBN3003108.1 hypothetical protein [Chromobacterium alkanivorans]